jgi:hypothetical protein
MIIDNEKAQGMSGLLAADNSPVMCNYCQWVCQRNRPLDKMFIRIFSAAELLRLYTTPCSNCCDFRGFIMLYAGVTSSNAPSESFHRSLGFHPVGTYRNVGYKLERWHDVTWWQLQLAEYSPSPAKPKTIAAVKETPEFTAIIAQAAAIITPIPAAAPILPESPDPA